MACFHRFFSPCGAVFQALLRQWSAAGVVTPKGKAKNFLRRLHQLNVWNRLPVLSDERIVTMPTVETEKNCYSASCGKLLV